jgi:ethanolamine utilization protein EutQ (cupin superfamily)
MFLQEFYFQRQFDLLLMRVLSTSQVRENFDQGSTHSIEVTQLVTKRRQQTPNINILE